MRKILLVNQGYFNQNLGDQAIRVSLNQYFEDRHFDVQNSFLVAPKTNLNQLPSEDYFNIDHLVIPKRKKKNFPLKGLLKFFYWGMIHGPTIYKLLKRFDFEFVVIGGGQILNTSYTKSPHMFAIACFWWSFINKLFFNVKLVFVGIGVVNKYNFAETILYRYSLNCSNQIFVRDLFSQNTLIKMFGKKSVLIPDVAFYNSKDDKCIKEKILLFGIYSYDEYTKNFNDANLSKDDYYNNWLDKLNQFLTDGYCVKFIYTTPSDYKESVEFKSYVKLKINTTIELCQIKSLNDLYPLLETADSVYSARMHALILGMKFNCKPLPYLLSNKLISFNKEYIQKDRDVNKLTAKIVIELEKYF